MLVLSHPRSGSTEICRIIDNCLMQPGEGVTTMGEFFNVADRTSFGDTMDAFGHFRTRTDPITIKVLVLDLDRFKNRQIINGRKSQVLPFHYLSETNITFNSSEEFNNWFYTERIKRLDLIKSFNDFYIVKHFITLFDNDIDNENEIKFTKELMISHFKQERLAFSYRKNLLETVFSGLIKTFYIDKARVGNKDNDFLNIIADGHNLHDMAVLRPRPIKIPGYPFDPDSKGSHYEIDGIVITNLILFEFYHLFVSKLPMHNILCYEDIMETRELTLTYAGKTQVYNIDELPPRIVYQFLEDGTVKELI